MSIARKSEIWSLEIYRTANLEEFFEDLDALTPIFKLPENNFRFTKDSPHTFADPFLFLRNDELFLFLETKAFNSKGQIECYSSINFRDFIYHGVILSGSTHFSYPFIFEEGNKTFMIPESSELHEIGLYEFIKFPNQLKKVSKLVDGNFYDSSLLKINNIYYILTSNEEGMQIFYSDSLYSLFIRHPKNPIIQDKKFQRNAGPILIQGNNYFRFSQDCSVFYGKNINKHEIKFIDKVNYEEVLICEELLKNNSKILGHHHISIVSRNEEYFIAIDKKKNDNLANKILSLLYRYRSND